jgi:hypothetical protein
VLHTHPGDEAYSVIDGATALLPDGKPINFEPGAARINVRDVPHGAFKVTGDKTLKLLTVHIVDKGKPMMVPVKLAARQILLTIALAITDEVIECRQPMLSSGSPVLAL